MSTVKYNRKNTGRSHAMRRFAQLATMGEIIFHTRDLAELWNIRGNTLHTTLKRYSKKKLLYRLWRGMYAIKPANQLDSFLLGIKALHTYGYVSCETILAKSGAITQQPQTITLISSVSRRFFLAGYNYYCRRLGDAYLYNPLEIEEKNGFKQASLERAAADLLYFNPQAHFDAPNLINWTKVRHIQTTLGYPVIRKFKQ